MAFDSSSAYTLARKETLRFALGPNMYNGGTTGRQSKWLDTMSNANGSVSGNSRLIPAQTYSAEVVAQSGGAWFQNSMTGFYRFSTYDGTAGTSMCITKTALITNARNFGAVVIDRIWHGGSWSATSAAFSVPSLTMPRSFDPKQTMLFMGALGDPGAAVPTSFSIGYIDGSGVSRTGFWSMNPSYSSTLLSGELYPALTPGGITRLTSWSYPGSVNVWLYWLIVEPKCIVTMEKQAKGRSNLLTALTTVRTSDCLDILLFKTDNSSTFPNPIGCVVCDVEVSVK